MSSPPATFGMTSPSPTFSFTLQTDSGLGTPTASVDAGVPRRHASSSLASHPSTDNIATIVDRQGVVKEQPYPELTGIQDGILAARRRHLLDKGENITFIVAGMPGLGKMSTMKTLFSKALTLRKKNAAEQAPPARATDGPVKIEYISWKRLKIPTMKSLLAKARRALPRRSETPAQRAAALAIETHEIEITVDGVPFHLKLLDMPAFADTFDVAASHRALAREVDMLYERVLEREVAGEAVNFDDHFGVDAVLYFIAPHALRNLDIDMMRRLMDKTAVIPIIAKADTLTPEELDEFRTEVTETLAGEGVRTYRNPFAVISSSYIAETLNSESGRVSGRRYDWGIVEADVHSDIPDLRSCLIAEGLDDLKAEKRKHYVRYRQLRLQRDRGLMGFLKRDLVKCLGGAAVFWAGMQVLKLVGGGGASKEEVVEEDNTLQMKMPVRMRFFK